MIWTTASRQTARPRREAGHPDRDAQFQHINAQVSRQLARRQPAISVDTKKKELVGDFKNGGREWRPKGNPQPSARSRFHRSEQGEGHPLRRV